MGCNVEVTLHFLKNMNVGEGLNIMVCDTYSVLINKDT